MVEEFSTKFAKEYRGVTRENERGGSARPIRMLRFVYRVFWPCQLRMGIDPIDSILLGSKFPEIVHGLIRPYYLHAPNLALLHWRQQSAHRRKYDPFGEIGQALRLSRSCTASNHFDHNDTP